MKDFREIYVVIPSDLSEEKEIPLVAKLPKCITLALKKSPASHLKETLGISSTLYTLKYCGNVVSQGAAPRNEPQQICYKMLKQTQGKTVVTKVVWKEGQEHWKIRRGRQFEALREMPRRRGLNPNTGCFNEGCTEITQLTEWKGSKKITWCSDQAERRPFAMKSARKIPRAEVRCMGTENADYRPVVEALRLAKKHANSRFTIDG
jgi:hypothetical protein